MSEHSLEAVLRRIRDARDPGAGGGVPLDRARALAGADPRVPAELREVLFRSAEEAAADAEALLAVLGAEPLVDDDLRLAFAGEGALEAGTDPGLEDGWDVIAAGLGHAVRGEAGEVDVAGAVARALDLPAVDRELLRAAVAEGGAPDLSDAVAAELGFAALPVAEAVRSEAGAVDVSAAVLAAVGAWRVEVAPEPADVGADPGRAAGPARAANAGPSLFGFAGFGMAAAVLLAVVVGRLASPLLGASEAEGLVFAKSGEVVVEELSTGSDVAVMQLEGDGGAVILWIDEEV